MGVSAPDTEPAVTPIEPGCAVMVIVPVVTPAAATVTAATLEVTVPKVALVALQ